MTGREGQVPLWERVALRVSGWLFIAAGVLQSTGRRYRKAEALYREALVRAPGSTTGWLMLGESLEGQGRWEEAAGAYGHMTTLDPSHANAYYHRACCFLELGRLEHAATDCDRAIGLHPKHRAAYVVLGQALSRQGRREDAIAAFERAVALKPGDREVAALLERERAAAALQRRG